MKLQTGIRYDEEFLEFTGWRVDRLKLEACTNLSEEEYLADYDALQYLDEYGYYRGADEDGIEPEFDQLTPVLICVDICCSDYLTCLPDLAVSIDGCTTWKELIYGIKIELAEMDYTYTVPDNVLAWQFVLSRMERSIDGFYPELDGLIGYVDAVYTYDVDDGFIHIYDERGSKVGCNLLDGRTCEEVLENDDFYHDDTGKRISNGDIYSHLDNDTFIYLNINPLEKNI